MSFNIRRVTAQQVLDSRGNPTVEVNVLLQSGATGRAIVPSGASTGTHEALELRDGGDRWMGKGVQQAVNNVDTQLAEAIVGTTWKSHRQVDEVMIATDGTADKHKLGANAILGVSLALAQALANDHSVPLWQWLRTAYEFENPATLPVPMLNVINGGEHANNSIDVQEFMLVPHGFSSFDDALHAGVTTFHALRKLINDRNLSTAVGDEGGFAPDLGHDTFKILTEAIEKAGFEPGQQISLALDVAATELYRDGHYHFAGEGLKLTGSELIDMYEQWSQDAPIVSIEDGLSEDDWESWKELTTRLGDRMQLVGDDLFVTNPTRLQQGIDAGVANSMLVKVNQIGSLSETVDAMRLALKAGYTNVISHRSGETEDTTIADLAVGTGCGQIKTGAPSRSDRVAKYNQLLRIERTLGVDAHFAQPFAATTTAGAAN